MNWEKQPLGIRQHKLQRLFVAIILAFSLLGMMTGTIRAQDAGGELGNWLIYNGTIRFSDRWSMFTEAQVRLWEVASNLSETLFRFAGQYDLSPEAMVSLGYLRADTWPFDDADGSGRVKKENRIYQQFTMKQAWTRAQFEHRFRLEQRWIEEAGETDYTNRAR